MTTGERLDDGNALYRADLARHRAAYRFAENHFARAIDPARPGGLVLDLGCGTGYGAASLAASGHRVVAFDRVLPAGPLADLQDALSDARVPRFVRGELERLPFAAGSVDGVASFQVIEHFADPSAYLTEIARVLQPDGVALFSTPNRLQSDGENPYHPREYAASELASLLGDRFERVDLHGIHAVGPAARYHAVRLRQIRRVTRFDPFSLRRKLPRALVDWSFARLSVFVRLAARRDGAMEEVGDSDYPVGAASDGCLDLLAICRGSKSATRTAPVGTAVASGR